jgi:hypothetical protein
MSKLPDTKEDPVSEDDAAKLKKQVEMRDRIGRQLRGIARAVELGQCDYFSISWDQDDNPEVIEGTAHMNMANIMLLDPEYENQRRLSKGFAEVLDKLRTPPPAQAKAPPKVPQSPREDFGDLVEDVSESLKRAQAEAKAEGDRCPNEDCPVHHPKPGAN